MAYQESSRALLERELMRRIAKNPRYSLRAFAKTLGVSHTALSLAMAGKRSPSKNLLTRFANTLGMPPDEKARLVDSTKRSNKQTEFNRIDLDIFAVIADWHHYAVLSLLELPGAQFEHKWIARRISIAPMRARAIMDRLLRLRLVGECNGVIKQTTAPLKVENSVSTSATRKFHQSLLSRALESLENDPVEKRDFSSMTFAMDEAHIPYAKERIRAFRRKLVADLEQKSTPNQVYNLTVQIYAHPPT